MERTIDLRVLTASIVCVALAISLLQLLPSRYYFNFSSIVARDNSSQFFSYKTHAAPATYCRVKLIEAEWDHDNMEADLAQACRVMERFDNIVYSVYPIEASIGGQRLSSQEYRLAMGAYLLQASKDASSVAAFLRGDGFKVQRGLDGLSEAELDHAFVAAQDVSVAAILKHMVQDDEVNLFDARKTVETTFPLLQNRAAASRAQLHADRETFRQSSGWVQLAEQFLRSEYSSEITYLEEQIYGIPTDNAPIAFLLKLVPPLVAGFLVALIMRPSRVEDVALGAGLVAFLLCWPVVVLWNVVVAEGFQSLWFNMFALYAAYIAAYFFLAKLGTLVGLRLAMRSHAGPLASYVDWNKVISTTATSLVLSLVTAILTMTVASAG